MNASPLRRPVPWAAALPLACAVHCVLMPLVALFVPFLAPAAALEAGLMLVSSLLALGVTFTGVRAHGRGAVWAPVLLGTAVWAASLAGLAAPVPEPVAVTCGSVILATGLVWNARLRHEAACRSCGCPAHGHGG